MANLILTKESSESEIKRYFNAVLELSKSDNEFPINLDEVWMLVYSRKSDAADALQRDFIEGVDYQVLRQNPQNPQGGRPTNEYRLSVPCMEFFIARKVRNVFEVYRRVFHKSVSPSYQIPQSYSEALMLAARQAEQLEEGRRQLQMLESENECLAEENRQMKPHADYTKDVLQSGSTYTLTQVAHDLGMRSVHVLTGWLRRKNVLFRQSNQWQPTAKVADKGYFSTRTAKFFHSDGSVGTSISTVVTEQGRMYLHNLLQNAN